MEQKKIGELNSYILFPQSEDNYPNSAVILLQGYGSNGRDLISLAAEWAPHCPSTIFISPDAPYPCEATPLGQQWFSLENYTREFMEDEIAAEWKKASNYIDAVINEYSLTESKIMLGGFSQGTMMALYTSLLRETACAGVLGYSGRLLNEDKLVQSPHKSMPIHLIHGSADTVVPVEEWEKAISILKDNKFNITGYKSKGLSHSIDNVGIESGFHFIKQCLEI